MKQLKTQISNTSIFGPLDWQLLLALLLLPFLLGGQQMTLSRQLGLKEISKGVGNAILEDSYGFMWFGGNGLHRYDGYSTTAYNVDESGSIGLGTVRTLLEDRQGRLWIGTSNGLFQYLRETNQVKRCFSGVINNQAGKASIIFSLYEDRFSRIWAGGEDRLFVIHGPDAAEIELIEGLDVGNAYQVSKGVWRIIEDRTGQIFAATSNGLWQIESGFSITAHFPDGFAEGKSNFYAPDLVRGNGDSLWLATSAGLWAFRSEHGQFSKINLPGYADNAVRHLLIDQQNRIWISTANGILIRHPDGHFEKYLSAPFCFSRALEMDRFGNIWIGTGTGIRRFPYDWSKKLQFYQIVSSSPYQDNFFFRLMQDPAGGFWFRLLRSGLGYSPALEASLEVLLQPPSNLFIEEIKNFCTDVDGNVWVITLTNGLFLFRQGKKQYRQISLGKVERGNYILADNKDSHLLWLSSELGLCSVDRFTYELRCHHPRNSLPWLDENAITNIEQDEDGNIWCTLRVKGKEIVGYFDKMKGRFVAKPEWPGIPDGLQTYQLERVPGGKIWAATNKGLIIIDTKQKNLAFWGQENGFPAGSLKSIIADRHGNIWFTSGSKIYKYDGQGFHIFNANEAIEGFIASSSALTRDGWVVFGGGNGLQVFDPQQIEKDTFCPRVYLTNFLVFNKQRKLSQAYELAKEISLSFDNKVFTFEFSGLHFLHPGQIKYRHKLEPLENEWVETGSEDRRATYTNLSPGSYTFKVLASNTDEHWIPEAEWLNITITVLPPWYRTWGAYSLWAALLISSLLAFYRFQLSRKLAQAEARRLKELDTFKSRLYANITHEFRTPLTIIKGIAGQLQGRVDYTVREELKRIQRNGQQLLDLVNQMLDLAKLESGSLPVNRVQGDVIPFLKYLLESFHSLAEAKGISLHFHPAEDKLIMDYDPEKLQQIVSNLLSNGIKFTPEGGRVEMAVERPANNKQHKTGPCLSIAVSDNGVGIPAEKLHRIFDRFYQVDDSATRSGEGTGIGLTLTKELVKLLGGEISVESKIGEGAIFTVMLPITHNADAVGAIDSIDAIDAVVRPATAPASAGPVPVRPGKMSLRSTSTASTAPTLLIIEDNADVIHYLSAVLQRDYKLFTAPNGKAGLALAQQEMPDIIVCDVMMPEMDGYELCRRLKGDLHTSHIPIILLTAKADTDSRIEGIEQGADAYLAKPFEERELKARLKKLLENRERLREYYTSNGFIARKAQPPAGEGHPSPADRQFFEQLLASVEDNLGDPAFSAEQLSQLLFISYPTCLRKVKAVTGKTVKEYVRHIRICRAARLLLEEPGRNIGAIAEEMGFHSNTHFTREFRKAMGCTPTEYRRG